jgi:hypothetical protein
MAIEYIAGGDPNALRKSATYMLLVAEAAEDVERQRQLQAARKRLWGWLENGDFTATAVDCHDGTIVSIRTEEWPRLELGTNHADDDVLRFRQEAAAKATQEWVDQYKHIRFWRSDVESLNVVGGRQSQNPSRSDPVDAAQGQLRNSSWKFVTSARAYAMR